MLSAPAINASPGQGPTSLVSTMLVVTTVPQESSAAVAGAGGIASSELTIAMPATLIQVRFFMVVPPFRAQHSRLDGYAQMPRKLALRTKLSASKRLPQGSLTPPEAEHLGGVGPTRGKRLQRTPTS